MLINSFWLKYIPNGCAIAMRMFTIISKLDFGHLINHGYNSATYVTDLYFQGDTYQSCLTNILDIANFSRELGFVIHSEKSLLT